MRSALRPAARLARPRFSCGPARRPYRAAEGSLRKVLAVGFCLAGGPSTVRRLAPGAAQVQCLVDYLLRAVDARRRLDVTTASRTSKTRSRPATINATWYSRFLGTRERLVVLANRLAAVSAIRMASSMSLWPRSNSSLRGPHGGRLRRPSAAPRRSTSCGGSRRRNGCERPRYRSHESR